VGFEGGGEVARKDVLLYQVLIQHLVGRTVERAWGVGGGGGRVWTGGGGGGGSGGRGGGGDVH